MIHNGVSSVLLLLTLLISLDNVVLQMLQSLRSYICDEKRRKVGDTLLHQRHNLGVQSLHLQLTMTLWDS